MGSNGGQYGQVIGVEKARIRTGQQEHTDDLLPYLQRRSNGGANRFCISRQNQPTSILRGIIHDGTPSMAQDPARQPILQNCRRHRPDDSRGPALATDDLLGSFQSLAEDDDATHVGNHCLAGPDDNLG